MQVTGMTPLDSRRSKIQTDRGVQFVLYHEEIGRYKIEDGTELEEETWRQILETVLKRRARERAMYLLERRSYTEMEIRRKLEEGLYPEEAVEEALSFLKGYRLVDDRAFGKRYVECCGPSRSRRRIRGDLLRKGVNREIVEEVVAGGEIEESAQIRALFGKRSFDPRTCSDQERRKMVSFLLRRGYSYETIASEMRRM